MEDIGGVAVKVMFHTLKFTASELTRTIVELSKSLEQKQLSSVTNRPIQNLGSLQRITLPEEDAKFAESYLKSKGTNIKIERAKNDIYSVYFYAEDAKTLKEALSSCSEKILKNKEKESIKQQLEKAREQANRDNLDRNQNKEKVKTKTRELER